MNKTLYIPGKDEELWERAEQLSAGSISGLVSRLLRAYVEANTPPDAEGFKKIVVDTRTGKDAPTIRKAFTGRWIFDPSNPLEPDPDESAYGPGVGWDPRHRFAVAATKKNAIAVYDFNGDDPESGATLSSFDNFEEFRDAEDAKGYPLHPANIIAAVADALNEPFVIELDI